MEPLRSKNTAEQEPGCNAGDSFLSNGKACRVNSRLCSTWLSLTFVVKRDFDLGKTIVLEWWR